MAGMNWKRLLVFGVILLALMGLFLILPAQFSRLLFSLLIISVVVISFRAMSGNLKPSPMPTDKRSNRYVLPAISKNSVIIESIIVLLVALAVASPFLNLDPSWRFQGGEAQWLTSSAQFADKNLHQYGYISLWQPWIVFGEPLIDNPFSFVLNPISTLPSLLLGVGNGIKMSIVLYTILAGFGGWAMGRVMGLNAAGRVLLAILCIGKGNMRGQLSDGYFQLGTTQAYLPWVGAGAIATLRLKGRWPVVLLALSLSLMFFGGNIYYTLPAVIMVGLLTLTHIFYREHITSPDGRSKWRWKVDYGLLRRMLAAGLLSFGLAAATVIPIFLHQGQIGNHPSLDGPGTYQDLGAIINTYFTGHLQDFNKLQLEGLVQLQFYYSYVAPLAFFLLLFVVLPPITPYLHRPVYWRNDWRIWLPGLFIVVFFTLWGAGQNPIIGWLYSNVAFFGQWRFVGRMLGVAAFWLAILLAMRTDGLWRAITTPIHPLRDHVIKSISGGPIPLMIAFVVIVIPTTLLVSDIYTTAQELTGPGGGISNDEICINWLRENNPGKELSVYSRDYNNVAVYIKNEVRFGFLSADFRELPLPSTVYNAPLLDTLPEYGITFDPDTRSFFREQGYSMMMDSPAPVDEFHCLWQRPNVLSYAFTVTQPNLDRNPDSLPLEVTNPISTYQRRPDWVALVANGDQDNTSVVTIQELAYPGWQVTVDGSPAQVEVVGGWLGVVLPPGAVSHNILFQFKPPLLYLGAGITILVGLLSVLYLMNAEKYIPQTWKQKLKINLPGLGIGKYSGNFVRLLFDSDGINDDNETPTAAQRQMTMPVDKPHETYDVTERPAPHETDTTQPADQTNQADAPEPAVPDEISET